MAKVCFYTFVLPHDETFIKVTKIMFLFKEFRDNIQIKTIRNCCCQSNNDVLDIMYYLVANKEDIMIYFNY